MDGSVVEKKRKEKKRKEKKRKEKKRKEKKRLFSQNNWLKFQFSCFLLRVVLCKARLVVLPSVAFTDTESSWIGRDTIYGPEHGNRIPGVCRIILDIDITLVPLTQKLPAMKRDGTGIKLSGETNPNQCVKREVKVTNN
jgi:hypothetical protein